jgi:hypothetical protein
MAWDHYVFFDYGQTLQTAQLVIAGYVVIVHFLSVRQPASF